MATSAAAPDLSLHIRPPSPIGREELAISAESTKLCLGLDMATARRNGQSDLQQRLHQPTQIPSFKKSSSDSQVGSSGGAARSGTAAGGGGKKSSRAPRMRWTTALHAHFVQAVQLLGGHESTFMQMNSNSLFCCFDYEALLVRLELAHNHMSNFQRLSNFTEFLRSHIRWCNLIV